MKITYTAPNRAHHYGYAESLHRLGVLEAFVSGFSRFSSRAASPLLGEKLKRWDHVQNLYLAALRLRAPQVVEFGLNAASNNWLDRASMSHARESDFFIHYRTTGMKTTRLLRQEGARTVSVLEEVNSHVDVCYEIMAREHEAIGLGKLGAAFADHDARLEAYELADFILCPSEFVRRSFVSKGYDPARLLKVNFGFTPVDSTNCVSRPSKGTFRLLYVGQINFRKGLRYAIEAFAKLKHPDKELVIVGPSTKITGLEKTSIPDRVTFTGVLKGDALTFQYRNADAFILPTLEEGLALVLCEALCHGLPVITTTNSGGEDVMRHGVEGYILPPGDANAIQSALEELADSPSTRNRMSAAATQTASSIGDWNKAAERLVNELNVIQEAKKHAR